MLLVVLICYRLVRLFVVFNVSCQVSLLNEEVP